MEELGTTSATGEMCFDLQKPVVGKPAGRVCITPFGEIRVEHRQLKGPVVFSVDRVLAVIDASATVESCIPALEREPLSIHLPRDGFTPANVGFVFRSPVRVGPFRYGAQQLIPLTRSQRRQGVEVDVLALSVAEPDLLVQAVEGLGVRPTRDVGASLARAIPPVAPEVEAEVLEGRRRRARRTAWKVLGFGFLAAALVAARASAEGAWESLSRLVLASVAAAALAGMAIATTRPSDPSAPTRRWAARVGFGLAVVLLLAAAIGARNQVAGAHQVLLWAAFAGLLAAPIVGQGLRGLARTAPASVAADPLVAPREGGWRGAVGVAAIAVLAIAGSAVLEEQAARPVREVQRALVDENDLPADWSRCCGEDYIFRGSRLDEHICGVDDARLPAHVAGVDRAFNDLSPGHPDLSEAHFDVGVFLAPTVADAEAEFAAIDDPDYLTCTATSIGKRASEFQPGATDLAAAEFQGRDTIAGLPDLVIDRFHIRVPVSGTIDAMEGEFVRARVGRAILRLPMLEYVPGALPEAERDAIIRAAIAELEEADL